MGVLRTIARISVLAFLYGSYEYLADHYGFFNTIYTHVPRIVFSIFALIVSYIVAKRLVG